MKILVFAFVYLGEDAGSTHVTEVWRHIGETNEVHLALPQVDEKRRSEYQWLYRSVKVHEIPHTRRKKSIKAVWFGLSVLVYQFALIRLARKIKPDVLYVRLGYYGFAPLLIKMMGIPYVLEVNGFAFSDASQFKNPLYRFSGPFQKYLEQVLIRKATSIITVTEKMKTIVSQRFKVDVQNITAIPNGADAELFAPLNNTRADIGLNETGKWVVFIGHFAPWQGISTLIEAISLVRKYRVNLLLVGDGPELEKLKALSKDLRIENQCKFVGLVPYNTVPKYINAADVVAAPFTANRNIEIGPSPLKIFEYMSCGKPVVTTKIGVLEEIIEKNKAGLCVEPDNPQALARAIEWMLQHPVEAENMGKRGRELAIRSYSWRANARAVSSLIERVDPAR